MSDLASRLARLSPEKQALLARQTRAGGTEAAGAEPLAIVGIGCRFPGGVDSPAGFWRLLSEGQDAVAEVPADRWSAEAYFDPDPARPGHMNTRWGSWLSGVDAFDSHFFGLAPRETAKMDPQQRLVLEVCWEALEDAGQTLEGLAGSRTGVFVGTHGNDYAWMTFGANAVLDAYDSTGTAHSIVANRVSYLLDLRGPSLALDTACSSSLVAVHLAAQALRQRECDLALACGVNLMLSPLWGLALSKLGMLSPDGRCRTFDARANGIVRGEGCGAVAIKRLSDALAAGDPIWAVVRGTATNSDGRTNGLTAPNGLSQQAVLRAALANAGIAPSAVGAIEAHGTGTPLGDPIEVEALAEVLGKGNASANPCVLGSVKTNIGHLEGAAGIAGLIKLVLSLHHEALPRLVHFEEPNPLLALQGTRFVLPKDTTPWPRGASRRIGGVSAFGFGGTNAHVVVEEAPLPEGSRPESAAPSESHVLVVSARSPEALRARADAMCGWLEGAGAGEPLTDICHTAWARRSRHENGLAVVGVSHAELASRLAAAARGVSAPGLARVQRGVGRLPGLVFAFTGQGTQWPGMGLRLWESETRAREALEQCEAAIREHAGWSLRDELARPAESSRLGSTEIAQPAIFAVQVAVAAWWRSLGVVPDAVVGHSMGEVAAAHVAGILSLEEAARVIVHRARVMEPTRGLGRMLAVELPYDRAAALALDIGASVAAVNSPTACVLSGAAAALEEAVARIERERGLSRWLPVEYAFHSAQMEPARAALAEILGTVKCQPARMAIASTVTGAMVAASDYDGAYWARNVREPVRFREAVDVLGGSGHRTFVEIGPHPALLRPIQQCAAGWEDAAVTVQPSLHRGLDEPLALRVAAGALHLAGYGCEIQALFPAGGRVVRFPHYPWQRERYPIPYAAVAARRAPAGAGADPLLGTRLATALETYELDVTPESPAWLGDHRIFGKVLYPAAALLASAWAVGVKAFGSTSVLVEGLAIGRALVVPVDGVSRIQIAATDEAGLRRVRIFSQAEDARSEWLEHASARVAPRSEATDPAPGEPPGRLHDATHLYSRLSELGAQFGPQFRGIRQLWVGEGRALADIPVSPPGTVPDGAPFRHPPLIDACLQVAAAALLDDQSRGGFLLVPVAIERAWCRPFAGAALRIEAVARDRARLASEGVLFDIQGRDETGALVVGIEGLHMRPSRATELALTDGLLCALEWAPVARPEPRSSAHGHGRWLLFVDEQGIGDALAERLAAAGIASVRVAVPGGSCAPGQAVIVAPMDPAVRRAFLDDLLAKEGPWQGVVLLWGLDAPVGPRVEPEALESGSLELLGNALDVVQALAARGESCPTRLWLVSRGACSVTPGDEANGLGASPLAALCRVAGLEHPALRSVRVDLDPAPQAVGAQALAAELIAGDDELDVAFRDGARFVSRLRTVSTSATPLQSAPQRLEKSPARLLEALAWVPGERQAPGAGEVEIRVWAAGLNFRDVLNALGLYPGPEIPLGNECVGEVTAVGAGVEGLAPGDCVIAVAFASIADFVTTPASMVVRKPAHLSISAAATLPIAFLTAHYALHELASVRAGDRVLIHAGAGGVGLAAVQLALRAGATVFATAGSEEKRSFLRRLGVAHTLDSRSTAFADDVVKLTGGRGVDVVLNSLSGELLRRSLEVTARGGRFLELGKRDIFSPEEMARQRPDVAYHVVYLGEVCERDPAQVGGWLARLVEDVAEGRLQPLPFRVFERTETVDAFRYMAQGRHVGKVIVQLAPPPVASEDGLVRPGSTHLVTGGLGGVGLALAEWLAAQGAGAIVLLGRSAPTKAAEATLDALRGRGTRIDVVPADVTDGARLAEVFGRIDAELPPLGGVWHAAGVLDDATLLQLTRERLARVLAPKLLGAWNLHRLTSHRHLDAFVLFSSISSLVGWPGQGNYAAGNAFLDGLAQHRRQLGLAAMSVNWGAFAGVGMAAGLGSADQNRVGRRGLRFMEPQVAFSALEAARRAERAQIGVVSLDFAAFAEAGVAPGVQRMLTDVTKAGSHERPGATGAAAPRDLVSEVAAAPAARRRALVTSRIREQALRTLGLAADFPLDPRQGLRDVGLDSLMAVELRNALQQLAGRSLPSTLLFDFPTVESLSGYLLDAISKADSKPKAAAPVAHAPDPTIADEDVEDLLREELAKLRPGTR